MVMKKTLLFAMAVALAVMCVGCNGGPPDPGFRVSTYLQRVNPITGLPETIAHQNVDLIGDLVVRYPGNRGTRDFFSGNTGSNAYVDADDAIAPAAWDLTELSGPCQGQTVSEDIDPGEDEDIYCDTIGSFFFFTVIPNYIDLENPPATVTIEGRNINSIGGMPTVEYWDGAGNFVASAQATEVAADGTWLRGPTPDLSQVVPGTYLLKVKNPTGEYAGTGIAECFIRNEPEPPPPCEPGMICQ